MISYAFLVVGLVAFGLLGWLVFDGRRKWSWRAFCLILLLPIAGGATALGVMRFSADHAVSPGAGRRTLFAGVSYERTAEAGQTTHVVKIDLGAKGLSFLVTPGDAGKLLPIEAKTPGEFLLEHKLELAIVGGRFAPGYAKSPWDEPLPPASYVKPQGRTVSRTVELAKGDQPSTLYLTEKNEATIGHSGPSVYNAITGDCVLVGDKPSLDACAFAGDRVARSAVGLDASGKIMFLVVVDGHRPGVADGMAAAELAAALQRLGVTSAVQLGAGPQAELAYRDDQGEARALSIPMGEGRADTERRVGAMLGVQAASRIVQP